MRGAGQFVRDKEVQVHVGTISREFLGKLLEERAAN